MFDHLDAIRSRIARERGRLADAKTPTERIFRELQVTQALKEEAAELKFLADRGHTPPDEMTDEELLAELAS